MFAARNAVMAGGVLPLRTKPTYVAATNLANTASGFGITLPTHTSGDIIFLWAGNFMFESIPVKPSAGGTVPNWTSVATGSGMHTSGLWYAVATSSSTTSGNWTLTGGTNLRLWAFVVRGGSSIGGVALGGSPFSQTATTTIVCPAVTLSNTRGDSLLIHGVPIAFDYNENPVITQSNTAGYTYRGTFTNSSYFTAALATKDSTTSDGSFTYGSVTNNDAGAYTGCDTLTVEIIPPG